MAVLLSNMQSVLYNNSTNLSSTVMPQSRNIVAITFQGKALRCRNKSQNLIMGGMLKG